MGAGRSGGGEGRQRSVERSDRLGRFHGRKSDSAGTTNIAEVTTAVANGDLSRKVTVDVRGEILELKKYGQHRGGPVELLCQRSYASGARGG